jgi:hypothetical protein
MINDALIEIKSGLKQGMLLIVDSYGGLYEGNNKTTL